MMLHYLLIYYLLHDFLFHHSRGFLLFLHLLPPILIILRKYLILQNWDLFMCLLVT